MLDDYSSFYAKHMGTVGNFQQIFVPLRPNFTSLTNNKRFRVYKISFPNTHRISSSTPSSFQHYFNDPSWSVSREEYNFKFRSNSIPNLFSSIDVKIYRLEDLYNYSRKKKLDPNYTFAHPSFRRGIEILAPLDFSRRTKKVSLTRLIIKRVRREIASRASSRSNSRGKYGNT